LQPPGAAEAPADPLEAAAARAHRALGVEPGPCRLGFASYADGRSTVREEPDGTLRFRVTDRLRGAPPQVLEGVLAVLLCKMHRLPVARADADAVRAYKMYLEQARPGPPSDGAPRRRPSRKHIDPVGVHRSLLESYLRVSLDMGLVLPEIPKLSWSRTASRSRFGHWDPDHQAVVISQVLDDPRVPESVLDYVLYHELLHIIHPVRMGSGTKRRVHTPEFKRAERKYPKWKEGDEWLRRLAGRRWRPLAR
jgi:hypothetical protein